MKFRFLTISPTISEITWIGEISDELLKRQLALKSLLESNFNSFIHEIRIGFKTLGILWKSPPEKNKIQDLLFRFGEMDSFPDLSQRIWEIPVCYDLELGRDLESLAINKNMEIEEVIEIHSQSEYRLHFYGFLPGFMYLNGLPEILFSPRKSIPDREVPAGSVAIGGNQTGIYPSSSPGGWHLIGQSPLPIFDPKKNPPVWAEVGDKIKFSPISKSDFFKLKQESPWSKSI